MKTAVPSTQLKSAAHPSSVSTYEPQTYQLSVPSQAVMVGLALSLIVLFILITIAPRLFRRRVVIVEGD
jgi:hypothetical protein